MRTIQVLLVLVILLSLACEKIITNSIPDSSEGFSIIFDDGYIISHGDIDYYDFSTHLIYLRKNNPILTDVKGITGFTVLADGLEIYTGQTIPGYSSYLPAGPVIHCCPSFFPEYIVPIDFIGIVDSLGNVDPDPRGDIRIVEALKKYDQFRLGLGCEIKSVDYSSNTNVTITLNVFNQDSNNYYILDPDKMGIGLFHYFTNGLFISDVSNKKTYTHRIQTVQPEPWNTWEFKWLSLIKSFGSKTFNITYEDFEDILPGQYSAGFGYPGLGYQVEKEDIQQINGSIWLGELYVHKDITIE